MHVAQPVSSAPPGEQARFLNHTATSHLGLRVPDIAAALRFYTTVIGLSTHQTLAGGGVRLGWSSGYHVIDLLPGDAGVDRFGFVLQRTEDLADLRARLVSTAVDIDDLDLSDADRQGFQIIDPDGNHVQFLTSLDHARPSGIAAGPGGTRFQHITLATTNVGRMLDFYVRVIGFRQSDVLGDNEFTWLRSNREHHTLALVAAEGAGIDHYAFDIASWEEMKTWCDHLTEEEVDITWGPGRHGPGNNLFCFFDDPAGHHIELSAELERFHDDRVSYAVRRWNPAPRSVNLWGGQLPAFRTTSEQN